MRLTVGPLSPAVYWRRRAAVLGAGLLFLAVLLYSCSGPDKPGTTSQAGRSASPLAKPTPTGTLLTPETGAPPTEEASTGPVEPTTPGTVQAAPPPASGSCTDEEMLITPIPSRSTAKAGTTIDLKLRIRNNSDRTCSRDVGADVQELYITLGAVKVWSSDTCGAATGSDVRTFPPNVENEYQVSWNGQASTKCDHGVADGPDPAPGEYQLFGRLGTRLSKPVKLTITA